MLELKTIVDQIELTRFGCIQIRFGNLRVKDGKITACQWHRTCIDPGHSVDAQLAAVLAHLPQMGEAPFEEVESPHSALTPQTIRDQVLLVHTPERVSRFKSKQAEDMERVAGRLPPLPPFDPLAPLEEKAVIGEIKLCRNGCIRVHVDNVLMRGNREISRERYSPYLELEPGAVVDTSMAKINAQLQADGNSTLEWNQDLSELTPQLIVGIVGKLHTPERIAKFRAEQEKNKQ